MANLTKPESIAKYGTEAYTGWGAPETQQDFNSKQRTNTAQTAGSSSNYSAPSFDPNSIPISQPTYTPSTINIDDYIQAIRDTLPAPPEEYLKANPFYFDEQAAQQVSTAEFDPYYKEILNDYLGDVKLTADKNQGDATRILADLDKQKQLFLQQNGTQFDQTIRGIKEGYSSKGLYFGGENQRTQAEAGAENTNKLEGYLNTYGTNTAQTTATNTYQQQQAKTLAEQKARDIGRQETASIAGGVNTQKEEAINQYLYGMKTYYKNPDWKSVDPSTLNSDYGNTTLKQGAQY